MDHTDDNQYIGIEVEVKLEVLTVLMYTLTVSYIVHHLTVHFLNTGK